MKLPEGITAEYMFGLLGYSTWNLYRDREWLGQVTLNAVDKTAVFAISPEARELPDLFYCQPFNEWMHWLRNHRYEPF